MKKKAITKIASIITFVLIAFVLTVILLIESNGGVSADSTKNKITVSKSSTVSIYVTGVGVDLVSSDSFQDVYSVEQATTVTIQAVNETHIFNEWAIENGEGIVNPNNLLSNDALDDSKTTFTMPSEDLTIKFTRSDPSQADYGKYMNNRFVIDSVEEFISLQTILSDYGDVGATETELIKHYDALFGNAEDYKILTTEEKVRYINATADSEGNKLATEKAYARLASGYFLVANNISVFTKDFKGIGTSAVPFNGVMCGLSSGESSQVVLVFTDKDNSTDHYGLFNYLGSNAVIRNLRVRTSIGVTDSGTNTIYAGGLAAEAGNALLVNTDVVSNINIECVDSADVYAGGFIGKATNTSIDDVSNIKSNRDNGAVIIETKGTAYSGYFAGYAVDSYVKELNLNISGLSMSTRNTGTSEGKNIYSGLVFGYLTNTKEIVLKDIKLTSTINFKVDNYINNNTCYTGGVVGYLNDTKTVNLGSISLENKSLTESIIRSNTQDGSSKANVFTGGLFGSIANKNVKSLNKFKNRISTINVDDKVAYVYDPVFTGNIGIESIQNGLGNGTYGKTVAGGIVAKGYIDINGTGGNTYKDGETHLVLSRTGVLNVKATQTSLSKHALYNGNDTLPNDAVSDKEHCISSMVFGLFVNGEDSSTLKNINVYGDQVNSIATREIGSKGMGDIYNACLLAYANGTQFENINLYFNKSELRTDSLSFEVGSSQGYRDGEENNAYTGALAGIVYNSSDNSRVVENISIKGANWTDLNKETGTKIKISAIQNTRPPGNVNYVGENYIGGIIGQIYRTNANNLYFLGSETEDDSIRMSGHENPDSAFCGGVIGLINNGLNSPNNEIRITDCKAENVTIIAEATIALNKYDNPDIFVGGVIGACYVHDDGAGTSFTFEGLSLLNSNVKAVGNEKIKVYCAGILGGLTWASNTHSVKNCYVYNSKIVSSASKAADSSYDAGFPVAYSSGIVSHLSNVGVEFANNGVVDTEIAATTTAAGICAQGNANGSEKTFTKNYSNATLQATSTYGISPKKDDENSDKDNYYVGSETGGHGTYLNLNKLVLTSTDPIFDDGTQGDLSDTAISLDYLLYVMSYNNGYKANAVINKKTETEYRIYVTDETYESLPDNAATNYSSFTINVSDGTQTLYYETGKESEIDIRDNTNGLLPYPAETYTAVTANNTTYYIPVLSEKPTDYHNTPLPEKINGVTYYYNNTDFTPSNKITYTYSYGFGSSSETMDRIPVSVKYPVEYDKLYINNGTFTVNAWWGEDENNKLQQTASTFLNNIEEGLDSKPDSSTLLISDYLKTTNDKYVKALTEKTQDENFVEIKDEDGYTRYINNVITESEYNSINKTESKADYPESDSKGHYKIVDQATYDAATGVLKEAVLKDVISVSGTNSVSYTITDPTDTKYYEDVVNVWVNFKGQGQAYPLDLSKSKEELASEGWFNMGEKIVCNKTGSLVTNTEITDIEFLYGYDYNEHSESRKNFSGAKEYVLTTTANTGNTSSTYTFGINVHETISYLKIKFYAPQTSEYFTSFTNTFAAYGTYEFSSKLVDVVETVDGVEKTVKKNLYEFILYPNFELTKDGSTTLQFVEKGGVINLNKFVFNFNKNDLQLVGVTYADYTPPLNYYEINNKTATEYDLYAGSITKFVPIVIKLNDLVRTEYVDEKYIELVSYTSSAGTIKASGELTVTDATTDEKVTLTPKTGLSGNNQEVTFNVYAKYDVTYSVIGMTPDCIPYASDKTDYYFPIYVDNGYVGTPETATIKIGTGAAQNIASLASAKLLDEEGNEVTFSDERSYYLLKIDKSLIKGTIHIIIEFPLVYQIKFDLQCATFNPNVTEMTRTYILRNTTTVYDYFGYGEKAYAPYITEEAYKGLTNKTDYTEFTDPVTKDKYYYLSDVDTHITPEEYEAKPSDEKNSYILFNQKIKYTELYNWIRSNTAFGYVFTGFYMVDNANTEVSYGEKFEDILEDKITLNTSLIFYARWSFLIELVEAPGTTIESSFSETFMYEINDSTLVNKTVKVPINNNRGYVFSIIKDENYLGEAGVKAYIVTKNHSDDQVLKEIYVEKYHENMYLYFIPPEQITGYLMLVTSISNSGLIVGEHTATVTEEILPEDGVMTFKYVANHRNTTDEVSYIYNSGDTTNPGSNLLLNKDFVIKFYQQVYNSSTHLTEREVRYLPEGSVVEVYYQKVVNNSIVKRIVGIKKIPADDDPSTTHSDVSELLLSSFITIDQEENSFAFPQNETYGSFLGSNQYVSEVYYFVVTPPNGFEGHAQDQILNFEIEGGYVDNNRTSGYVEGVRTTHDFVNKPLVDYDEVQIEKSNQNKVYSVTPSRETQLTIGADGTYEFEDHKHYEIFRIDTQYAGIDNKKLVIYDGVGKNTIIQSQKLPFKLLGLNLELGYGTGNINVYGGREVDGIVKWYIIDTINVSEIQYNDYEVSFEGYEITNADDSKTAIKFDYFKLDNISGNEIKLQSMAVYSLETGMTYEINEFEFAEGTEQIAFEGDVINDIRHDGKTFMLAIQLKKDGKIVENIPTTLTITVSGIDDPVNPFIDNGENGRVAAYFNLSDCLKTLGGDIIDFTISIPSGYELYAVQLLEAENANKPAMSEVRATIYHSPLNN